MAKINAANVAPDALPRIRGVIITQVRDSGVIVQAWPQKRGPPKTFNGQWTSKQFSLAAQMAANSEPMQMETARYLTKGTVWLPRDLLMMAAVGKAYEVTMPDGTVLKPAYHGPPATVTPVSSTVKQWQSNVVNDWLAQATSSSSFASKGTAFIPAQNMTLFACTYNFTPSNGATYRNTICVMNASNVVQSTVTGVSRTLMTSTRQNFTFEHSFNFIAGTRYAVFLSRTDAADTYALPLSNVGGANWLFECQDLGYAEIAKKTPAVGDTVTTGVGSFGMQMLLDF